MTVLTHAGLTHAGLVARVCARFPTVMDKKSDNGQPFLLVPAAELLAVARFLRDEPDLRFDALMDLTGYDLQKYPSTPPGDAIAVVYLLFSYAHRHKLTLMAHAPRAECTLPTVSALWPAALYFEREVWDLLGVQFAGHPSLLRIMCPQDWIGHPLRKDYVYPAEYNGIAHLRDGQHFDGAPHRVGDPTPAPAAAAAPAPPPGKRGHGA